MEGRLEMTLDRSIALLFLVLCAVYGYTAFVTMENGLLPFELNMSFLPNTLPKVLSILGAFAALFVMLGGRVPGDEPKRVVPDGLKWNHIAQAVSLLAAMVAYALLLRPLGFISATSLFLVCTAVVLGERKLLRLVLISLFASFVVWYLVQQVLEIVLRPWPWFIVS
jgi:putative tricarboxylic transport membrane protein